jgi:hypothetical protein
VTVNPDPSPIDRRRGRVLPAALAAAALPLLLLADVLRPALVSADMIRQIEAAEQEEIALLSRLDEGLVLLAVLALLGIAWAARAGAGEVLGRIALAGWGVTLALGGFQLAGSLLVPPRLFRPGLRLTLHPDPQVFRGTSPVVHFSTSRLGLRGTAEWDDHAYRVLCVGGSTTVCMYLDDEATWPEVTMTMLNARHDGRRYWVGNAGKSGLDTLHHLALLRRFPEASHVQAVVVLCGVNDFNHSLRFPEETRRRLAPSQVFDSGGPPSPLAPMLKQTLLYRTAHGLLHPEKGHGVEDERGEVYNVRRAERRRLAKDYPLPDLTPYLETYEGNLAEIAEWCRSRGIRCVFMTQPTTWQDPMPAELEALSYSNEMGGSGKTLSAADLARGVAAFNERLVAFCRSRGIPCVDLAAALPKDATIHYDQEHFTVHGAREVAALLAQALAGS